MSQTITVGLGYRFANQRKPNAHFTLIDINTGNHTAKLLAVKSKKWIWVDIDSLILMQTEGNKRKAKALIDDDGTYLKGLIGAEHFENWIKRINSDH